MKKLFAVLSFLLLQKSSVLAQSDPSSAVGNVTTPRISIAGGTFSGLSPLSTTGLVPLPYITVISRATSAPGTFTSLSATKVLSVTNGSDVITANNNANNVLVFGGTGSSTAKSLAVTSLGGFIATSNINVNDGVALKSDAINTAVLQGLNSSGTSGYDTNLTLYRPTNRNNAFLGVTMSAIPHAEEHLWMGTDYANNRYVFTETIAGTGSYHPVAFRNGQADAFVIGAGARPPTTFYGGGVVLAGAEGNQMTWSLGGQVWTNNVASGGNWYVRDGTHDTVPLTIVPNSTASLTIGPFTSTFTQSITPSSTAGIVGTITNDDANAGSVGEYRKVTTARTSVSLATATPVNLASLPLASGDWDISCTASYSPARATAVTNSVQGISTASATFGEQGTFSQLAVSYGTGSPLDMVTPLVRESLARASTVYCVGQLNFATGTATGGAVIRARRVR